MSGIPPSSRRDFPFQVDSSPLQDGSKVFQTSSTRPPTSNPSSRTQRTIKDKVFIFAAPGGLAYGKKQVDTLAASMKHSGADVSVIGDGESSVKIEDVGQSISSLQSNHKNISVFVMAHGDTQNGVHKLKLDSNFNATSEALLKSVSNGAKGKPVDVFLTACHGGDALKHVDILPRGSCIVALSPGNETVAGSDVERFASSIKENENPSPSFSSKEMLNTYLCKSLKNRIPPNFSVSGEKNLDVKSNFLSKIGKPFSEEEKSKIHSDLNGILEPKEIDRIIEKVATSKNEWNIYAVEYGPALAICMAAKN